LNRLNIDSIFLILNFDSRSNAVPKTIGLTVRWSLILHFCSLKKAIANLELFISLLSPFPQHSPCFTLSRIQWVGNIFSKQTKQIYTKNFTT